jgi:serine protease
MRVHRLAVGCVGILLSSGFALGANPALAAGGPFRVPSSSVREAAGAPMAGRAWNGPTQAAGSTATGAYTALSPTRLLDTRKTGQTLGAAGSLNLTVTAGSVPSAATAVALNVTVTDTTASSYLSVYPAGETQPLLSNLNWVAGETVPNMVMVPIGSGGQVTFYNNTGSTDVVVDLEGYFAAEATGSTSGSYVPLAPARITDTRPDSQEPNSGDTLGPGSTLDVQVAGAGDVPSAGVTAALLNVTVTDTTSSSFLAVYPQGTAYPGSSNLNWLGGETVANRVVVPVGTSGEVELFNNAGSTDVVVDVDGYFTNGSSTPTTASLFSPITPVRVLDTRNTTGQTLGPGATLTQAMAGVDGIASNASAVVTNVTATDTTAASFFTVYPGGTMPLASDVNWGPGQTVPNLTVASLSGTGTMDVYNHSGSADLVIDAFGYFAPETSGGTEPQTVTFSTSAPTDAQVGDGSYTPAATATSGLSATITLDATSTGCALASGVVSFTSNGTCVLDANQPGNATYAAAPQVQQSFAVSGGATSIGSSNWSGYAVTSGPYSSVTGTFTVPSLVDPPANVSVSEWVGIDGAVAGDNWVIQAGVDEQQGCGSFCVIPWWEIITPSDEAPATEITDVTVDAGDEVTVTINQVSGTTWDISLTDDTNRQEFSNEFLYTGPATSAEWIVEDPSGYAGDGGGLYPFSDYTTTTFSDLGFTGAEAGLTEVILIQSGEQLSTPSAWTGLATGFAVAYGDVAPPPP